MKFSRETGTLRQCITNLRTEIEVKQKEAGLEGYEQLAGKIPGLHFMSCMVFKDERYDPLLTIELNVDGDVRKFLPRIEVPDLQSTFRQMIRCCKKPANRELGAMYDAITATDSKAPLAPFLEGFILRPAAYHQGNRGLDRDRILEEKKLFVDVLETLKSPSLYQATAASEIHKGLRAALIGKYPWLGSPEPKRWSMVERIQDYARLAGFVAIVLICLSLPGMILALLMPALAVIMVCLLGAYALWRQIPELGTEINKLRETVPKTPGLPVVPPRTPANQAKLIAGFIAFFIAYVPVVAFLFAVPLAPFHYGGFVALYKASAGAVFTGLLTIPLPIMGILVWLRRLEERDWVQEDPHDDPKTLRAMMALEDQINQNHMGSVVLVKPGVLRAVILRVGLLGLGLLLRVTQTSGYLASMRTIHFAHWAILGNGGRLAFFSNFDGSWESYLDDFIEKAHVGLTLAWTNGVGFPYTRFLVNEGAMKGRLFKVWARHSMAEGLFWISAYKDLSVNQIERHYRIASGLRKPTLSEEEAKRWAWDL